MKKNKLIIGIVLIIALCALAFNYAKSYSADNVVIDNENFGASVIRPNAGGTGTSTNPTFGQVLMGNAGGTYDVVATSTLGIIGGGGIVTSVDLSVPTGLTISGNPITTAGTLALGYDTGYSTPLTASTTEGSTAYTWGDWSGEGFITLTSLSGTSPITYNNGTGAIGINTADTSTTGALTSTDWNTFNNKQPAGSYLTSETDPVYIASQASNIDANDITNLNNLSGTNTGDITLAGTPNYLTLDGQEITMTVLDISDDTNLVDGTGLTFAGDTLNVDTSQNIATLSNLTDNGFVVTTGGTGALSIDTSTYLTGNESISLSGDISGTGATSITTTIGANKILETMLKSVNEPTDEYSLTYEATTGDFEWQDVSAGSGASTALDNLASVAINTSLLSDTADTDSLGSATLEWLNAYIGDAGKLYFGLGQDGSIEHSAANELTITASSGVTIESVKIDGGVMTGVTLAAASNVIEADTVLTIAGLAPNTATTQATQPNITSLGTLTTLTVDNINLNGSTITGVTTDANTVITAYGGKAIAIEGVSFDGGVVTGASSISSTGFTGALTGNADTVTGLTLNGEALTLNTGALTLTPNADDSSVLTIGAGAVTVTGSNTGDLQTLSAGVSDVNATAGELNILDLSATALTTGWGYFADGASTASWRKLLGSEINNDEGWTGATDISGKADIDQTMYIGTTGVAINRTTAALTLAGITLTTPNLGTPTTLIGTNISGTGASFTAGAVTNGVYTSDFPLNQNTTGSAATLTTQRLIGGINFDGSANIVPTTIVVADTEDTTTFVGLWTDATGNLLPKTDEQLTYVGNTGVLTAVGFVGALTGQASTVATITGLAPDTATTQATQASITTIANQTTTGTIGTGTWQATDVGVAYGGTGVSTLAIHGVLVGNAATDITALTVGTNGQILVGSTGADPVFATLNADRSLTATLGAGTIEIDADVELYTEEKGVYIESPIVESLDELFGIVMNDITITYIYCNTDTGTLSINLEDGSANNILSAELVCDAGGQTSCASGCDVNTINASYDNITAKTEPISYDASAVASDPTKVSITIGYIKDD